MGAETPAAFALGGESDRPRSCAATRPWTPALCNSLLTKAGCALTFLSLWPVLETPAEFCPAMAPVRPPPGQRRTQEVHRCLALTSGPGLCGAMAGGRGGPSPRFAVEGPGQGAVPPPGGLCEAGERGSPVWPLFTRHLSALPTAPQTRLPGESLSPPPCPGPRLWRERDWPRGRPLPQRPGPTLA